MGIKSQLRTVQDQLQKIKITHANRRRQRVHRVKSKKSRTDTTQPQSPGSGKSCTFEILDEEQISQGQINKFEKGCISEDISIRDESTTGT